MIRPGPGPIANRSAHEFAPADSNDEFRRPPPRSAIGRTRRRSSRYLDCIFFPIGASRPGPGQEIPVR